MGRGQKEAKGFTVVVDAHAMIVSLLWQLVFGVCLDGFDQGCVWQWKSFDLDRLRRDLSRAVYDQSVEGARYGGPAVLLNLFGHHKLWELGG